MSFEEGSIELRIAKKEEKRKIYDWLTCPDISKNRFDSELKIPTWEKFNMKAKDEYFDGKNISMGGYFIIKNEIDDLGVVFSKSFHLKPGFAEFELWMKDKESCGKGYGTFAVKTLMKTLREEYFIEKFIVRPSIINIGAIKAYSKCGFIETHMSPLNFLKGDYINYVDGEYGVDKTITMINAVRDI